MRLLLLVYLIMGVVIGGGMTIWAAIHGEEPTFEDFAVWAMLYPYYLWRLFRNK